MDQSYRDLFFGESLEYLKEMNKSLVALENNPQDLEAINVIFRLMHTLKGMAATMGFKELAELAHRLEDGFDNFRSGKMILSLEIMDIVFESMDAFNTIIDDIKEERPISIDVPAYLARIDSILVISGDQPLNSEESTEEIIKAEEVRVDPSIVEEAKSQDKNVLRVYITLEANCAMKGVRAFLILERSKKFGNILGVSPNEEAIQNEKFANAFEFVLATIKEEDIVRDQLKNILEVESADVSTYVSSVNIEKKDSAKGKAPGHTFKKIQSMRIPVERLDKIMNLMGELSIFKSRLVQTVQNKDYEFLDETAYLIERLVSSLQDEALKLRLLPVSYILDNFPRVVRDLSRREKKEIDLKIEGSDIELDRVILDELGDSLVHILRNSIDHGLEGPQERIEAGKVSKGKILIKVFREKGHIIIEVSDDGRGMDISRIAKKAVDRGIIGTEEAAKLDSHRVLDIITLPGFSTKDEVSDLSGRGVGLDVVKSKLDSLGGRLDLDTELGKGTKFTLVLPLTLAIIKAMLVYIGEQVYAIPLMSIRETVKVQEATVKMIKDVEVIRLRDEVIPILRLGREFGMKSANPEVGTLSVVIAEGRLKSIGLVVDKIIGEQDIVVKPLGSYVKRIKGIAGATILGDGRVALILDVVNLM